MKLVPAPTRSAPAVGRPHLGAAWADGAAAAVLACLCGSLLSASPCPAFAATAVAAEPAALSQAASSPVADETWALLDKYYLDRSFNGLNWPAERQRLRSLEPMTDERAFDEVMRYVSRARSDEQVQLLAGGEGDKSLGYFVQPTLLRVDDPQHPLMTEEIFGPVVTVCVYPDAEYDSILRACESATDYALTGAIFATDRQAIRQADEVLRFAAGNFYVNDKPSGSVVGQQPFGGSRKSGTNDKAGSAMNLMRWTSPRVIKETFLPPTDHRYPSMRRS